MIFADFMDGRVFQVVFSSSNTSNDVMQQPSSYCTIWDPENRLKMTPGELKNT